MNDGRQMTAIGLGILAALFIGWFIISQDAVAPLMDDVRDPSAAFLTSPLIAVGTGALLFYPAFYVWLRPYRAMLRLIEQLAVVGYVLVILLAIMGGLAAIYTVLEPRQPDFAMLALLTIAMLSLLNGARALRRAAIEVQTD